MAAVHLLGVSLYELSLFVHISAVVVGLGATFAESVTFPVAMRLDPRHLPYVHRLHLAVNRWLASPALLLVLVTGVYQVEDGGFDFGAAWISASLAIVLVLGAIVGGYLIPADRRLATLAESEIAASGEGPVKLSDDYARRARMTGIVGALASVLVLVVVFLMVVQPGA